MSSHQGLLNVTPKGHLQRSSDLIVKTPGIASSVLMATAASAEGGSVFLCTVGPLQDVGAAIAAETRASSAEAEAASTLGILRRLLLRSFSMYTSWLTFLFNC